MIRIVHISRHPFLGLLVEFSRALGYHSGFRARSVTHGGPDPGNPRKFATDMIWERDREEVLEELSRADIIQVHDDEESCKDRVRQVFGEAFVKSISKRAKWVQHIHATRLGRNYEQYTRVYLKEPTPVSVDYRFVNAASGVACIFPDARIMPNLREFIDSEKMNFENGIIFSFSPTRHENAFENRYFEKAIGDTLAMLYRVKKRVPGTKTLSFKGFTFDEAMRLRMKAHAHIDQLTTGGLGVTSFETANMGRVPIGYVDEFSCALYQKLTGADWLPFVNVRLEEAEPILIELARNPNIVEELGRDAQKWYRKYYDPRKLIQHHIEAYQDIMDSPAAFAEGTRRQRGDQSPTAFHFMNITRTDLIWNQRRKRYRRSYQSMRVRFSEPRSRFSELMARFFEPMARFSEPMARFSELMARFYELRSRFSSLLLRFFEAMGTVRWQIGANPYAVRLGPLRIRINVIYPLKFVHFIYRYTLRGVLHRGLARPKPKPKPKPKPEPQLITPQSIAEHPIAKHLNLPP